MHRRSLPLSPFFAFLLRLFLFFIQIHTALSPPPSLSHPLSLIQVLFLSHVELFAFSLLVSWLYLVLICSKQERTKQTHLALLSISGSISTTILSFPEVSERVSEALSRVSHEKVQLTLLHSLSLWRTYPYTLAHTCTRTRTKAS